MISRVAEHAFWLQRYVERASSLARLLLVSTSAGLDAEAEGIALWTPVLITTGEQPRFQERFGVDALPDGQQVLDYLTWDTECPVSIRNAVRYARENARVIRETISREVWEAINREYLWIESAEAAALYADDPGGFLRRARDAGHQFRGAVLATMPHAEPMHFMSLGQYVECADQTARILDVTHHAMPEAGESEEPVAETVTWMQALLACGAYEAYFKAVGRGLNARRVAHFLLRDPRFPRSVHHCLAAAAAELDRIDAIGEGGGRRSAARLDGLRTIVEARDIDGGFDEGLHEALTRIVDGLAAFNGDLYPDFFDPALGASASPSPS